jgi:phospholipid/cholesterol/gamma-HCH transport system substrate-binding protein
MQFLKNTDPRFHLVETRARFFIFIAFAGLVGLVAFVIWKQEIFRSSRRIDLMASSSQGIQRGMAARLSGFRIGKVGKVELEGENRVRVSLEVFSEYAHFLRGNSVATIASESLIGDRFIDITAGSASAPELKDGDTLPLSPEKSIGTLVESLKDEIRPAVVETREIISFLNDPKGDFKLTLGSLRVVSESLKSDVPKIMQDTQKAAQQGTELFTQLNRRDSGLWQSLENLDQLTRTLAGDFPPLLARLNESISTIQLAADSANQMLLKANAAVTKIDMAVKEAAPEIPRLLRKGTDTLRNADEVITSIKGLWPVSQGVPKKKENLLRLPNER